MEMAGSGAVKINKKAFIDPTIPRPSARIPTMPTPFNYEKPSPQVPDVSLIFDSSSLISNQTISPILRRPQNSINTMASRATRPPTPPPNFQVSQDKTQDSQVSGTGQKASSSSSSSSSFGSLEVQMMYDLMKKQEEAIVRLETQLKSLINNQDSQSKNIETILNFLSERLPVSVAPVKTRTRTCDQGIQTDVNLHMNVTEEIGTKKLIETCTTAVRIETSTSVSEMCIQSQNQNNNPHSKAIEKSRSSSSADSSLSSTISPPSTSQTKPRVEKENNVICVKNSRENKQQQFQQQQQQQLHQQLKQQQQPINRFENGRDSYPSVPLIPFCGDGDNNKENLSTILRDLQLPTIAENSLYSEVSIPQIDMQEFNDSNNESDFGSPSLGASASACGSSSDEEDFSNAVQPTMTFYRNVIGNVNKMLETTQDATLYGDTTTMYGMSSNNLSFATKQYLQKYGLVEKSSKTKAKGANRFNGNQNHIQEISPSPTFLPKNPAPTSVSHPHPHQHQTNHRVLNMNALKNQPKFV